jgi:hypothetical protein
MKLSSAHSPRRHAWLALGLLGASALALGAERLSPEERLAAIRKGLVQAALEGPTQVSATQWIDGKGVLQESSSFRAGMEVRGVRVLGYDSDAQGEPQAKLQWVNADPSRAPASALAKAQCSATRLGKLQHVVAWNWTNAGSPDADTAPLLASLQAGVVAQLEQGMGSSAVWRLVERPRQSVRSSYEQALLGSSLDTTPWQLELQAKLVAASAATPSLAIAPAAIKSGTVADTEVSPSAEYKGMAVQLRMVLTARQQKKPVLQSETTLPLKATVDNWGAPGISTNTREQMAGQMQLWRAELERHLGCLPVVADVVQAGGAQLQINVGSAAGVQVGDEWILANDQNAVQRALEPGVVDQTVLAQVQSVGAYHAELRAIAGNKQNVQASWTAWSASALR